MNFETLAAENTLLLPVSDGIKQESLNEIVFFQSNCRFSEIFLANKCSYIARVSLKELEIKLPQQLFIRSHRAYIVNIQYVSKIEIGRDRVILKDNIIVPLSRRKRHLLIEALRRNSIKD